MADSSPISSHLLLQLFTGNPAAGNGRVPSLISREFEKRLRRYPFPESLFSLGGVKELRVERTRRDKQWHTGLVCS